MAKSLDELLVYQKALKAADEVSRLLERIVFAKDPRLRQQLGASSERVASLIAEGFALKTDRHFASYLYQSRGSSKETRTQLRVAVGRKYLTRDELTAHEDRYVEIEKMLTGLIHYLNREDWEQRG
jgi:four helix bundle protein